MFEIVPRFKFVDEFPVKIDWNKIEGRDGGKYRGENNYVYNKVKLAEAGTNLYVLLTNRKRGLTKVPKNLKIIIYNYAYFSAMEVIDEIDKKYGYKEAYPLGRHFYDELIVFYKRHWLSINKCDQDEKMQYIKRYSKIIKMINEVSGSPTNVKYSIYSGRYKIYNIQYILELGKLKVLWEAGTYSVKVMYNKCPMHENYYEFGYSTNGECQYAKHQMSTERLNKIMSQNWSESDQAYDGEENRKLIHTFQNKVIRCINMVNGRTESYLWGLKEPMEYDEKGNLKHDYKKVINYNY